MKFFRQIDLDTEGLELSLQPYQSLVYGVD